MAFYKHFVGGFRSHSGVEYDVIIEGRKKAQSVRTLVFSTSEPLVLERRQEDSLFAPIRTISAELRLLADRADQYTHLSIEPPLSYRLTVKQSGQVVFVGWIESGLGEEPYDQPPYAVSITATDGLPSLQDYPCMLPFPELHAGSMIITVYELIVKCLETTGDHIPFDPLRILSRLATGTLSVLSHYIDVRALLFDERGRRTDESAHETLSSVLSSLGMRVYQHRGRWVIDRPADLLYPFVTKPTGKPEIDNLLDLSPMLIDTTERHFVSEATYSYLPAYGSMVMNLNVDRRDNMLRSRIHSGEVKGIAFDANPDVWQHTGFTDDNRWVCKPIRSGGFDLSIQPDPSPGAIHRAYPNTFFYANFRANDILQGGATDKLNIEFRLGYFNGMSDSDVYVNSQVVLLQGSKPLYVAAYVSFVPLFGGILPASIKDKTFIPYPPPQLIGLDPKYASLYGELVRLGDLAYDENKPVSMKIDCRQIKHEDVARIDGVGLIIGSAVYRSSVDEDEKKEKGEGYRPTVDVVVNAGQSVRLGSVKISVDNYKDYERIDALTVMLDQTYQRRADEIDIRLRTNAPYCHVYDDSATAVYSSIQAVEPVAEICIRELSRLRYASIEQLAAEDRFPLYATKRAALAGTLNRVDLSPLSRVYKLSTDPNRVYTLTSEISDLLDDSAEITIEEILPPTTLDVEWQS